jgi:hypothetical protein
MMIYRVKSPLIDTLGAEISVICPVRNSCHRPSKVRQEQVISLYMHCLNQYFFIISLGNRDLIPLHCTSMRLEEIKNQLNNNNNNTIEPLNEGDTIPRVFNNPG